MLGEDSAASGAARSGTRQMVTKSASASVVPFRATSTVQGNVPSQPELASMTMVQFSLRPERGAAGEEGVRRERGNGWLCADARRWIER